MEAGKKERATTMAEERGRLQSLSPFSSSACFCVTLGDCRGIGPEVTARALAFTGVPSKAVPLVIGPAAVFSRALDLVGAPRDFWRYVPLSALSGELEKYDELQAVLPETLAMKLSGSRPLPDPESGQGPETTEERAGRLAGMSIEVAVILTMAGVARGIVTAPIHKGALNRGGYRFPGHTEMLKTLSGSEAVAMMLVAGKLRVTIATTHIPFHRIVDELTSDLLVEKILLTAGGLAKLFDIQEPMIGLCALNPHAGEGGMIGDEEERILVPAIARASREGVRLAGPLPADTIFQACMAGELDAVVALYHDQGMIPIKVHAFGRGVNLTLGLPFIRTSPDHGTALDRAWWGTASSESMESALALAGRLIEKM